MARKNMNPKKGLIPTVGDPIIEIKKVALIPGDTNNNFSKFIYLHEEVSLVEKIDPELREVRVNKGIIVQISRGLDTLKVGQSSVNEDEVLKALRELSHKELDKIELVLNQVTEAHKAATKIAKLYDGMDSLNLDTPGKDIGIDLEERAVEANKPSQVFVKEEDKIIILDKSPRENEDY